MNTRNQNKFYNWDYAYYVISTQKKVIILFLKAQTRKIIYLEVEKKLGWAPLGIYPAKLKA